MYLLFDEMCSLSFLSDLTWAGSNAALLIKVVRLCFHLRLVLSLHFICLSRLLSGIIYDWVETIQ